MSDKAAALLECWADWRRTARWIGIVAPNPHPPSMLGILIKRTVQSGGEQYAHNDTPPRPDYDEALMGEVDRAVAGLQRTQRLAVMVHYCRAPYQTAERKARMCGCGVRAYWHRLETAHAAIEKKCCKSCTVAVKACYEWRSDAKRNPGR